jgi:hypothetical protein
MGAIEGGYFYLNAGAPGAGINEVQTLTIGGTPTGGTFKIVFDGHTSGPITWSATDLTLLANIQAALDAMPNVGTNGIVASAGTLSSGIGTVLLTFGANLTKLAVALATAVSSLTGTSPTLAIAETTAGVTATARGAAPGALLIDTTNKVLYMNTGTALAPTWTEVGVISSGEIVTAMLASKAVTGVKLDEAALNGLVFTGAAAAGACTLTGAKVGDKVVSLVNLTDATNDKANFEATITVADQIQQSSASNLSAKKFAVMLVVKS